MRWVLVPRLHDFDNIKVTVLGKDVMTEIAAIQAKPFQIETFYSLSEEERLD